MKRLLSALMIIFMLMPTTLFFTSCFDTSASSDTEILKKHDEKICNLEEQAEDHEERIKDIEEGYKLESNNQMVDAWLSASGNQVESPYSKINGLSPTITFIDDDTTSYNAVKRYHDVFVNFCKNKNLYNMSANTDGYRLSNNGIGVVDDSYSISEYISVDANTTYTFSRNGIIVPSWMLTRMAFYNSNKIFISDIKNPTSFTTPDNTAYLRFTTSTVRMEGSEGKIQLEKGSSASPYEEFGAPLKGLRGCYAVVTDYLTHALQDDGTFIRDQKGDWVLDSNSKLKNTLLSYEEEGFGMLFHAKWQDTFYMTGNNRDIEKAERDYCKGIRTMREIGFIDYDYWVSPYGVMDEEIAAMCKRHGAKCLLSTYNNTFIGSNGLDGNNMSVDRYAIPRCSFGNTASQYPNFTLEKLKIEIDKCVQNNGWLIITSHAAQWGEKYDDTQTPEEALSSIIEYALDSGCDIKTFSEAYAERNIILMLNDIC